LPGFARRGGARHSVYAVVAKQNASAKPPGLAKNTPLHEPERVGWQTAARRGLHALPTADLPWHKVGRARHSVRAVVAKQNASAKPPGLAKIRRCDETERVGWQTAARRGLHALPTADLPWHKVGRARHSVRAAPATNVCKFSPTSPSRRAADQSRPNFGVRF